MGPFSSLFLYFFGPVNAIMGPFSVFSMVELHAAPRGFLMLYIVCFSNFQMINGYLRSQGILVPRQKIRSMLRTADPVGTASRWGRTVARRTYFVPTPNSLWHIDGHMKLIRFVSILLYGRAGNNLSSITSHFAIQTGQNATQMENL